MARFNHAGRGEIDAPVDGGLAFGGTPAVVFGASYAAGSASTLLRTDDQIVFPPALMSSANSSTLTVTDDATNQTWTGAGVAGRIIVVSPDDSMSLPSRVALGSTIEPTPDSACLFTTRTSIAGVFMRAGLEG